MYTDAVSQDEINANIISGTREAMGQFNDQVNETRGVMFQQGLQDSVLASQVGLDERQELADSLNINAQDLRADARKENKRSKEEAEGQYYDLKSKLAERRRQVKEQGFANMVDGATGVVGYLNEPKYLASLKNQGSPQAQSVMGYSNAPTSGAPRVAPQFGVPQPATNFGRQRALGKPNMVLPPQVNTGQQSIAPQVDFSDSTKNPYRNFSNASDRVAKRKKKGSFFRNTTYSRNARGQ